MDGFGKWFASTFTGSMVGGPPTLFALWSYVIANAMPPRGEVELNPVLLATIFGCEVAQVEEQMARLLAPDPRSRTKLEEGRRLRRVGEFLYEVINFTFYRELRNAQERRDNDRERKRVIRAAERKPEPEVESSSSSRPRQPPDPRIEATIQYWRDKCGHAEAKSTPGRRAKVAARLREGYTVEQLHAAIDAIGASAWHRGENDRNKRYDDLTLILRDGEHVERYAAAPTTASTPDLRLDSADLERLRLRDAPVEKRITFQEFIRGGS